MCESEDINIEFRDLCYTVKSGIFHKTTKQILKNVSGVFKACELSAVCGPSGSGKSSLLNILSGYVAQNVSGLVEVNNSRKRSYIMQEENLHKLLTVNESMTFSINFKTGSRMKHAEKKLKIREILENLGLDDKSATFVRDLSGGQQKRLSIALELVDDPSMLFLDEPTTGLDSSSSTQCIQLLKKLAQQGKTIVCTIHTPSALIFKMFDHLYVLADGCCIYQGSSLNLISFLSENELHCPESFTPCDFLMEIANGDYGPQNSNLSAKMLNGANESYRKIDSDERQLQQFEMIHPSRSHAMSSSSFSNQLCNLIHRNFLNLYRDKMILWIRLAIHIIIPVMVGVLFRNTGNEASKMISNFKFVYAMSLFLVYTGFYSLVIKFALDVPTLKREHFNRWYSTSAYYISVTLADVPLTTLCTCSFVSILYFMSNQPIEQFRFLSLLSIQLLLSFVSQGLGMMIGSMFRLMGSLFFAATSLPIIVLFGGFLITKKDANRFFRWVFDICFVKQAGDASMSFILGYNRSKLNCDETFYCHYQRPQKFLQDLGVDDEVTYEAVVTLLVYLILFRLVAFFMIKYRLKH